MKLIRYHFAGIIVSLIVGFLCVIPNIYLMYSLGDSYHGIYMTQSDAEPHYISRMAGCLRENSLGNPYYVSSEKYLPSTLFSISECILVFPLRIFSLSITEINLVYKFLLPVILSIVVYIFIYSITKRRLWSIVGLSLVMMGSSLASFRDLLNIINFKLDYNQFILYARPVNPQFSSLFFFGFLFFFLRAIKKNDRNIYILCLLIFGLSFYIYFYTWTFILALLGSALCIFALTDNLKSQIHKIILLIFSGLSIGGYAVYELVSVMTHPYFKDLSTSYDLVSSRMPIFSTAGSIISVLFIIYFFRQKDKKIEDYFILSLLLSAFASINQQVLTGIVLQSGHYHWYFNVPIYFISLVYLISKNINNFISYKKELFLGGFLVCASIYSSMFIQYSSYTKNIRTTSNQQDYGLVFDWLNKNAKQNSVVLAPPDISELLPAFSPCCYSAYEKYTTYYLLPPDRRLYNSEKIMNDLLSKKNTPFPINYVILENNSKKVLLGTKVADIGRFEIREIHPFK